MERAVASTPASAPPPAFEDGLGERRHTVGAGNETLEVLRLNTVLSAVSSFEFALRERAGRLANFRHSAYGRVRAIERLDKIASTLVVVSDHVAGTRLSELLEAAQKRALHLDVDAFRCLIRQLVSAVAALQESVPEVCHGAIGPERIVITSDGRLVLVEYVLGAALEQLRYSQERYWRELGVALPAMVGPARFDPRADAAQIGTVALALLLGRQLGSDEYPLRIEELVSSVTIRSAEGGTEPLPADLREWLLQALQLDPNGSFTSAIDARNNLKFALGDPNPEVELEALRSFITACGSRIPASAPVAEAAVAGVALPESAAAIVAELAASAQAAAPPEVALQPPVQPETPASNPGLEALRSFLNRYPSRDAAERTTAKPAAPAAPVAHESAPATQPSREPAAAAPVVSRAPVEASKIDTPKVEASKIDTLKVEASKIDTPKVEASKVEQGKLDRTHAERTPVERTAIDPPRSEPAKSEPSKSESRRTEAVRSQTLPPVADEAPAAFDAASDAPQPLKIGTWPRHWLIAASIALIVLTSGATLAGLYYLLPSRAAEPVGTLIVGTNPEGVPVLIDGTKRGATPFTASLSVGDHVVELVMATGNRRIPVRITEGGQVSQFIELPNAAVTLGSLQVRTEPPRANVTVDGRNYGRSPITVNDLTPGLHTVVLDNESGSVTQRVTIAAGGTASLVVSMTKTDGANAAGWISIAAPADVQVFEGQRLIGTNRSDRIMMPVGRHELSFVNETLAYRATRTIEVQAGQLSTVRPEWPQGTLAINAIPWAEVFVDGDRVGETPIGSLSVPIGSHEIVFRHPELGDRRATVTVTAGSPARVGVDLRTK